MSQEVGVVCRVPAKINLGRKNRQQAIILNYFPANFLSKMPYFPASITMPEERLFWISAPLSTPVLSFLKNNILAISIKKHTGGQFSFELPRVSPDKPNVREIRILGHCILVFDLDKSYVSHIDLTVWWVYTADLSFRKNEFPMRLNVVPS